MDSLQEAFIHPPELCEGRFIMDVCTLFHVFRQKTPAYTHWKAWRGQDNFLSERRKSHALRVSKTQANFHFWVN